MRTMSTISRLAVAWICLASVVIASTGRAAQAECSEPNSCRVFMPMVQTTPIAPLLVEPAAGTQIISLAPLLSWTPTISSTYRVQVSDTPTFSTTEVNSTDPFSAPLPPHVFHITGSNLQAGRTYYWRVGVRYEGDYQYSSVRMFQTPTTRPTLPAPPVPSAPSDRARLPTNEVTLGWQAVPGALYYRVRVFAPDSSVFDSAVVPAEVLGYYLDKLAPRTTYTWRVRTFDQYGWGSYSTPQSFITP